MINSEKIEDLKSFEKAVESIPEGKAVALRVMRDGVTRFIAYTPAAEE
jgi:S1-C subfamily serine protease